MVLCSLWVPSSFTFLQPNGSASCLALCPSVILCGEWQENLRPGLWQTEEDMRSSPPSSRSPSTLFTPVLSSSAPQPTFTPGHPLALAVFPHLSWRPCKCTDHLDFKTVGPLFISGQAAAWFYGVIKVLTGVIKASNCTAETLGVYFKGPWVFILLLLWGLVKAACSKPTDWLLSTEVVKITALDKLFQSP